MLCRRKTTASNPPSYPLASDQKSIATTREHAGAPRLPECSHVPSYFALAKAAEGARDGSGDADGCVKCRVRKVQFEDDVRNDSSGSDDDDDNSCTSCSETIGRDPASQSDEARAKQRPPALARRIPPLSPQLIPPPPGSRAAIDGGWGWVRTAPHTTASPRRRDDADRGPRGQPAVLVVGLQVLVLR